MKILVSTHNSHKLKEIKNILQSINAEIYSIKDIELQFDEPEETGETLEENAYIKAKNLYDITDGYCIIADDSGLFVEALNGEPGVHSARYAGEPSDDHKNNLLLLERLKNKDNRNAEFRSVICFIDSKGKEHYFHGRVQGKIIFEPKGENGFGYDPYFLPDASSKTFAEMNENEKNLISHRKNALSELVKFLETQK